MKKWIKRIIACALSLLFVAGLPACGDDTIVEDENTLNVRVFQAGYGVEWLYKLKDKFEAAYADENYKVNILTPSNTIQSTTVINELAQGYSGVDLYFPGALWLYQVTEWEGGSTPDEKMLIADLTESVYDKPAISFNGEEESLTVRERLKKGIACDMSIYHNGREYSVPWADSACGLVVNEAKLTHTVVGGTSGYPQMFFYTLMAQYMGYEKYLEFLSYEEKQPDGSYRKMVNDGYKVYENEGILEMLKVIYQLFDTNYMTTNALNNSADVANAKIANKNSGAVFMSNGNWALNEINALFPGGEEGKNIRMINFPVISALGRKVFGAGTSANITDDKECDALLGKTVTLVDENETDAGIVSKLKAEGYNVTEANVARIREARVMCFNRCYGAGAVIPKGSPKKDVASLFLRMFASEDNAAMFFETVGANTPFDCAT